MTNAFWVTGPGEGAILPATYDHCSATDADSPAVSVRALYSGVSRGTESLVFNNRVPPSEYDSIWLCQRRSCCFGPRGPDWPVGFLPVSSSGALPGSCIRRGTSSIRSSGIQGSAGRQHGNRGERPVGCFTTSGRAGRSGWPRRRWSAGCLACQPNTGYPGYRRGHQSTA